MSELLNNFRLGRMEKDLDDRLLINGSYRDALNVEVATSDGSDVGALQKVLGNIKIGNLGTLTNPKCIGSIRYNKTDKIYWFITSDSKDIIAEYDDATGLIKPVIVDTDDILKFNSNDFITGSNIIDSVLYFTDNRNEPKEVDIDFWKNQTVSFATASTDLTEDKITVIKKSPLKAITYDTLSTTVLSGAGTEDGENILMRVNGSTTIAFSQFNLNSIVDNITFVEASDETSAVDTTFIVGTNFAVTDLSGRRAKFTITSKDINTTPHSFSARIILKDADLINSELNSVSTLGPSGIQQIILNSSRLDTMNNASSTGTISLRTYRLNVNGTSLPVPAPSTYEIPILNSGVYDLYFAIPVKTVTLSGGKTFHFRIYKNEETALHIQQPNVQTGDVLHVVTKSNVTLLKGETVSIGIYFSQALASGTPSDALLVQPLSSITGTSVNGAVTNNTNIAIDGTASGTIVPGMIVTASGLTGNSLFSHVYVVTVTDQNNLVLSEAISVANDTAITFTANMLATVHTDSISAKYDVLASQTTGFYEDKFPRFSYRYKYNNGQYSCLAPFSEIGFVPGTYRFDSATGFNQAMVNTVTDMKITGYEKNIPTLTKEIDIIYKDSSNQNLYVVDNLKKEFQNFSGNNSTTAFTLTSTGSSDFTNIPTDKDNIIVKIKNTDGTILYVDKANYTYSNPTLTLTGTNENSNYQLATGAPKSGHTLMVECFNSVFEVKDEQIFRVLDSIQLLRPFDSVPKKALTQEIIANRLVYANYTENFNYDLSPNFLVNRVSRTDSNGSNDKFKLSVKSNRTYQVGISFQDIYGRQTPIFSSKSGIILVDQSFSGNFNSLTVSTKTVAPTGTSHYRYYIKEISGPYYNLPISNYYFDRKGFIHLMCNSADINKIKADDYVSLKKKNGIDTPFNNENNKFKVLDVSGETPDFLNKIITTTNSFSRVSFGASFGSVTDQLIKKPGVTPFKGFNKVLLNKLSGSYNSHLSEATKALLNPGVKLTFSSAGRRERTDVYEISAINFTSVPNSSPATFVCEITFKESFGEDVDFIYEDRAIDSKYNSVTMDIVTETVGIGNDVYNNKFFIKIKKSLEAVEALDSIISEDNLSIVASAHMGQNVAGDTNQVRSYYVTSVGTTSIAIRTHGNFADDALGYFNDSFVGNLKPNNYIRISNTQGINASGGNNSDYSSIYRITSITSRISEYSSGDAIFTINVDKQLTINSNAISAGGAAGYNRFDILNIDSENTSDLSDPAVIEILPEDGLLDIYYETDNIFPMPEDPPNYNISHIFETGNVDASIVDATTLIIQGTPSIVVGMLVSGGGISSGTIVTNVSDALTAHKTLTLSDPITVNVNDTLTFTAVDELDYSNCISFGNGVESDRIRDDFNAPVIGKGVRVSAVIEDNYSEETLTNRFIYSQIYNSSSGVNRLNQFIIADKITKDINPSYGSIQKLHARDTDLIALCEDKCLKVLASKDALFNADGNSNLTSSSRVLGQVMPFVGEYGISKNPESFAQYGFRSYFTDRSRGVVLRLSRDGLSEISANGMSDFFSDKLANVQTTSNLFGTYDDRKNCYNLSFNALANSDTNETLSFMERVNGWTSRKSFVPESGLSINNKYFTFKNGDMYKHHSSLYTNDFYSDTTALLTTHRNSGDYEFTIETANADIVVGMYVSGAGIPGNVKVSSKLNTNTTFYFDTIISNLAANTRLFFSKIDNSEKLSSVKFIMNEGVNQVKRFKNLSYEGDAGWLVDSIKTNEHSGTPSTFVKKEGKYYSSLSGVAASNTTLNAEEFNVQGLGVLSSVNGSVLTFTSGVNNSIQIGDNIYFLNDPNVAAYTSSGTCTAKTATTITVSGTAPAQGKFVLFDKGGVINQAGLLGFFAEVEMKHTTTDKAEIFSVGSLVV